MKPITLALGALIVFGACLQTDDPEKMGQICLAQARDFLGFERFAEARAAIDSLRNNYPRAFNAREEGILLLDSIDLQEAQKDLEKAKASLDLGSTDATKDSIEFDKEEAEQKITFFTKKLAHDKANFKKH